MPKEESRRKRYEEVRWCKGKYEEVLEEARGPRVRVPRVPWSRGPKVQGSKGPRYLKLTFKYELDSKEGPSCWCSLWNFLKIRKVKVKDNGWCNTLVYIYGPLIIMSALKPFFRVSQTSQSLQIINCYTCYFWEVLWWIIWSALVLFEFFPFEIFYLGMLN